MSHRPTIQECWDQLRRHDWYYSYSDDHRSYTEGADAEARLRETSKLSPEHEKLWTDFREHHFSGPHFGSEKVPLPSRPEVTA